MNKQTDSLSKKGYGNGFISKTDRFKNNTLWQQRWLPGPGSYSTMETSVMSTSTTSGLYSEKYKRDCNSHMFKTPSTASATTPNAKIPGPGSYNILRNQSVGNLPKFHHPSRGVGFNSSG